MAARDDSPPVSLFSFQDIITSITGIMFLVVLLLALVILDSSILNSASENNTTPPPADPAELRNKIASLRKRLQDSRKEMQTLSLQMDPLLSLPLEQAEQELALQQERRTALKQQLAETERILRPLQKQNQTLERESRRLLDSNRDLDAQIRKRTTELAAARTELEEQKSRLEKRKKLISYSIDSDFPKKLLIVECNSDGIRVKNTATGELKSFIDKNDLTYASSISAFLKWAKTRNRQTEYFSLVITPDAFGYVNNLDHALVAEGVSRGREILPSGDSRILEESF